MKPLRSLAAAITATLLALGLTVASAAPASASTASHEDSCFGYTGIFKDGTTLLLASWNNTTLNECFGIAPDRTIWHAWPGSGGWLEMPNNGRADKMVDYWGTPENRYVRAWVASSNTYWCSWFIDHWYPWAKC